MSKNSKIEVKNLVKSFGENTVLNHVNETIEKVKRLSLLVHLVPENLHF